MQVLCMVAADDQPGVACPVCGQTYKVYFSRFKASECEEALLHVRETLSAHHHGDRTQAAHPVDAFNVPEWSGAPLASAAALLGGAPLSFFVPPADLHVA